MKTMNLGHERNPVAIGQAVKNLFLVFTGGVSVAMLLIATEPLSHFQRYKIVTVPSSPENNQSPKNNHTAVLALATAAQPPGETPPIEEKKVPDKPADISPEHTVAKTTGKSRKAWVFHAAVVQPEETEATKIFLQENELRNDSIVKELAQTIDMHECRFERASSQPLDDGLMNRLDSSVAQCLLKPAAWSKIIVLGFTDNRGARLKNIQLGMERAEKLKAILIAKGIPASRITTASFGAALPIDTNNTETGRARNRRAELNVLGNAASAGL